MAIVEVTLKKEDTLKLSVEGLESYPQEFSYSEWLEFTCQCITQNIRVNRSKVDQEKYAVMSAAGIGADPYNAQTLHGGSSSPLRPKLGGNY